MISNFFQIFGKPIPIHDDVTPFPLHPSECLLSNNQLRISHSGVIPWLIHKRKFYTLNGIKSVDSCLLINLFNLLSDFLVKKVLHYVMN